MNNFITVMSQNTDVTNSMFTMLIPFVIIIFFFYFLILISAVGDFGLPSLYISPDFISGFITSFKN